MKVRELKAILAEADDEAEVVISRQTTYMGGSLAKINPHDVFEAHGAIKQPSGKVSIFYDESKRTTHE